MFDLHTHSTFSDGVLIPSEVLRRAYAANYKGIAITDHADFSNYKFIIDNLLHLKDKICNISDIKFLPGIEITHVIPEQIPEIAESAKKLGAEIVVVHGETIAEPVASKTNFYAVSSEFVDILAHPGLITEEEALLAKKNNIALEITTRKGHSLTNGYVFKIAQSFGVKLVLNNDAHTPSDFVTREQAEKIVLGCGGRVADFNAMQENAREFFV
jgi:histidinol phosphatase-like PHP family hydrolase